MRFLSLFFFLLFVTIPSLYSQPFTQDTDQTKVEFIIKNAGFKVDGRFEDVQIDALFNESDLAASYFRGTASVQSIDTDIKGRNKSLQKKKYFDAENHPNLEISSSSIKKTGDQEFEFKGTLTIKGISKPLNFPFTVSVSDDVFFAKGAFSIDRRDFEVGGNSLIMGDEVKVTIVYAGKK